MGGGYTSNFVLILSPALIVDFCVVVDCLK